MRDWIRGWANRRRANVRGQVNFTDGANGPTTSRTTTQIWCQCPGCRGITGLQLGFQGQLIYRAINLAKVVDAGIGLGGLAGANEVGNRDRSEEADDGHHDHDFNEGETGFPGGVDLHSYSFLSVVRHEHSSRRFRQLRSVLTDCLLQPQGGFSSTDAKPAVGWLVGQKEKARNWVPGCNSIEYRKVIQGAPSLCNGSVPAFGHTGVVVTEAGS